MIVREGLDAAACVPAMAWLDLRCGCPAGRRGDRHDRHPARPAGHGARYPFPTSRAAVALPAAADPGHLQPRSPRGIERRSGAGAIAAGHRPGGAPRRFRRDPASAGTPEGTRSRAATASGEQPSAGTGRAGTRPGHRLAHRTRAGGGIGAPGGHHRRADPGRRVRHRAGRAACHDAEHRPDAERAVVRQRGLQPRIATGESAGAGAEPHAGAGQRPTHRRLPDALPGPQQLRRCLQPAAGPGRSHRDPDRQWIGGLRLRCRCRRRQHPAQAAGRRHHGGRARGTDGPGRCAVIAVGDLQRLFARRLRWRVRPGGGLPTTAVGL